MTTFVTLAASLLFTTALLLSTPVESPPAAVGGSGPSAVPVPVTAPPAPVEVASVRDHVELFGYSKVVFTFVAPPHGAPTLGARNGFRVANARVGVRILPASALTVVMAVEGSVARRDSTDPVAGTRAIELKDAFADWVPYRWLQLRAGQFKAPFNAEALLHDDALPFVARSPITEGAAPPEGALRGGLGLERQIGVQLSTARLGGAVGLRYQLALVNGNGPNALLNDNDSLTPVARLAADYQDVVALGVNGYYDVGAPDPAPTAPPQKRLGAGLDLSLRWSGLSAMFVWLWRESQVPEAGLRKDKGTGAMAFLSYAHAASGLEGGVRVARYEPSALNAGDQTRELTAMLAIRPGKLPARFLLQYTWRLEERAFSVSNDSLDAMLQVTF